MPDHIHVLFVLGERLPLHRWVAKFKFQSRPRLPERVSWQRNFYEHRLRPDECAHDYARYIFLNPYRKGCLIRQARWPFWALGPQVDFDFLHALDEEQYPPATWLAKPHGLPSIPPPS